MDRAQATELQKHLLDAAAAIDRAGAVAFSLDERAKFADSFGEIVSALHFKLLHAVYIQYPELKPLPEEEPTISSLLRWDEVTLPASVSQEAIDSIIFSFLTSKWQKMAMVVGHAVARCRQLSLPVDADVFAARLQALAESHLIEGAGDLRKWRYGEVRLKSCAP